MKTINKLHTGLAVALIATIGNLAQAQPASAQLLDVAKGALTILGLQRQAQPQFFAPQPAHPQNRHYTFGADNFNGNTMNLCITGCLPRAAAPRPVAPPVFRPQPGVVMQRPGVVNQQGSVSSTIMRTQTGNLPPGAVVRPGVPVPPQTIPPRVVPVPPRPQPRRPILHIPPISLPFNL